MLDTLPLTLLSKAGCRVGLLQLLLSGVSAEEHLEGTIADPELLMEVRTMSYCQLLVSTLTRHASNQLPATWHYTPPQIQKKLPPPPF